MSETAETPPGVDPTQASPARMYDYILGGIHNFPADRALAEQLRQTIPDLVDLAWANRGFHQRAVAWLAREAGIRQFVDVGSGLPTQNNTHEIAQSVDPVSRVVYVDIDPMVIAHATELLSEQGNTAVVLGDIRDPDGVLAHPELRALIDLDQPVGLLMTALLHFVPDEADPHGKVAALVDALAPGSYLALSHGTNDMYHRPDVVRRTEEVYRSRSSARIGGRTRAEVERFFAGLEFVPPYDGAEPGLSYAGLWGAEDPEVADDDPSRYVYCGVAWKP
ncbi:MAG TPA: SAM-dependent methyltransferase [Actinopolymorphaceae bacterium]